MMPFLMLASLLGVATFFLPFAVDTSPLQAIQQAGLWRVAVPFLVPFIAVIARMIATNRGSLSPGAKRAVYVWAAATALITLSFFVPIGDWSAPANTSDWIGYVGTLVVYAAGARLWLRSRHVAEMAETRPFLALRLAYLPNAGLLLYSFLGDGAQVGAYLTLVTTVIYAVAAVRGEK